jgi:hypothetical protein
MPYTREDFQRDIKKEALQSLTDEDVERLLKGLKPKDRLKGLNPEDILEGLKPEEIDALDAYLKKIKSQGRA